MEAVKARRPAILAALAFALAAAALWASVSLAGGSGTSGNAPSVPAAGQVAGPSSSSAPIAEHGDDGDCPNRGGKGTSDFTSADV